MLELIAKSGITGEEIGQHHNAYWLALGLSITKTNDIQGSLDYEDFCIMPFEGCDCFGNVGTIAWHE